MKAKLGLNSEATREVELTYEQWTRVFSDATFDGQPVLWAAVQHEDGTWGTAVPLAAPSDT